MQDKNYVVYIHKNKADGKRYVGTTRQNPERRWQRGRGYAVKVVFEDGQALLFESVKAACEDLSTPKNSAWRYLKQGYPDREGRRWCYA